MARYDDLAAFAAVVRVGSFTRAAAQMGVTQSALSQTIRALEHRLDLKLLNRTTRSVSPTEAGERLYLTVGPRFADIVTFRRNGAGHFRRNDATGNGQFEGSNGDQGCLILPPFASSVLSVSTPGFSPR